MQEHTGGADDRGRDDPAALAQSIFARFEERQTDAPPLPAPAARQAEADAEREQLLGVVRDLEQVTAALVATSTALAQIAEALAEEAGGRRG
jgi:hypothetical protein